MGACDKLNWRGFCGDCWSSLCKYRIDYFNKSINQYARGHLKYIGNNPRQWVKTFVSVAVQLHVICSYFQSKSAV